MKSFNSSSIWSKIFLALMFTTLLAAGDVSISNTLYGGSGSINEGLNLVNMDYQNQISISPTEAVSSATGSSSVDKGTSRVRDSVAISSPQGPANADISLNAKSIGFSNSMVNGKGIDISYGIATGSAVARYSSSLNSVSENIDLINAIYGATIAVNPNEFNSVGSGRIIGSGHLDNSIQISHRDKSCQVETNLNIINLNNGNTQPKSNWAVYAIGNEEDAKNSVDLKVDPGNNGYGTMSLTGTSDGLDTKSVSTPVNPYSITIPAGIKIGDYMNNKLSNYVDSLPDMINPVTGKNIKDQIRTNLPKFDFSGLDNQLGKYGGMTGGIGQELYMGYSLS